MIKVTDDLRATVMHNSKTNSFDGILTNEQPIVRRAVFAILCVLVVFMAAGPLGFYPAGDSHMLILLVPVALSALLFGKWRACFIGALAGFSEMIHAIYQPFDYYEKCFSFVLNSIVMVTLFALLMGILFSFANRLPHRRQILNNGTPSRGIARMGALLAACMGGSLFVSVFLQCGIYIVNQLYSIVLPTELAIQVTGIKAVVEQICLHTILIGIPVVLTDIAVAHLSLATRKLSVRSTFQIWFSILTVVFFMVASGVAYTAITHLSTINMNAALSDHLESLATELKERDQIVNTLYERKVLPKEELRAFSQQAYRNIDCDLPGWSQDIIAIAMDDTIFTSTNDSLIGASLLESIAPNLSSISYEDTFKTDKAVEYYQGVASEISFMRAKRIDYERLGGSGTYQLIAVVPSSEVYLNRYLYIYLVAAVFLAMLGAIFLASMRLLDHIVVRSVTSTNNVLERITAGELDQRIPDSNSLEFSSLSSGINTTVSALEDSIAEASARIDRELATARAIQESALPTAHPPFPNIDAFDLAATMDPAREVGGDFYDFFELEGDRIGFVIADVSGKGIPAALFMMAAKTAIHGAMETEPNLANAIKTANRSLCEGNESEMFVTVFAGVFNYRTGQLSYVNAGHNKPLIMHEGEWEWLSERSGPYLGSFDWVDFKQCERQLAPGDMLFAYTDGVNEAFNVDEERFGNDRLESFLASHSSLLPQRLVRGLRANLNGWSLGADQSDDITMLALKYGVPPEHSTSLPTQATLKNWDQIEEFITQCCEDTSCPHKVASHVLMAVEELVVNVCNYAYPDAPEDQPGPLRIYFTHQDNIINDKNGEPSRESAIVVEVWDNGVPFNPLLNEDPQRPKSIEEAKVGGLGLAMTKKLMDEVEYAHEGVTNATTITKRWVQ